MKIATSARYTGLALAAALLGTSLTAAPAFAQQSDSRSASPASPSSATTTTAGVERERAKSADPAGDFKGYQAWAAHALSGKGVCK